MLWFHDMKSTDTIKAEYTSVADTTFLTSNATPVYYGAGGSMSPVVYPPLSSPFLLPYPPNCSTCGKVPFMRVIHLEGKREGLLEYWKTYCSDECLVAEVAPWRVEEDGTPGKIYPNLRELLELD